MADTIRIAFTQGDPGGVGPELLVRLLPLLPREVTGLVYGYAETFQASCEALGLAFPFGGRGRHTLVEPGDTVDYRGRAWPRPAERKFALGEAHADGGFQSAAALIAAVRAAIAGEVDGIVTAPLNKLALGLAGFPFPGHTELIGELCGVDEPVMMLVSDRLKTVPATIHLPLRDVPARLDVARLTQIIRVTHHALVEQFGERQPTIAVCGLNPHASDGGRFGTEEAEIIEPALRRARRAGIHVQGPFAADSLFHRAVDGGFSAVIGMYHDQALIPLKLLSMGRAVNVTLGIPIVRTSVDHGTAYDIAGRGTADIESLREATRLAYRLIKTRRQGA